MSSSSSSGYEYYQMINVANCELSDSNEHDVMYTNFENSTNEWGFYEKVRLRRDLCFDGKLVSAFMKIYLSVFNQALLNK